jgi:C4-dicarboxylate transporter DctQ subunit|tara:strand:+ start:419 stop:1003 length:585 start_codon:yes stop_codon:yes gene_type:complete
MRSATKAITRLGEFIAAIMMAAMFATFILQVFIRYTARTEWIAKTIPIFDPNLYGWTLEFCLVLWIWLVFWGSALIVRERDHVSFDLIYTSVSPKIRKWMAICSCLVISAGFLWVLEPTWEKFYILRLKRTATLSNLFGDWIRVRDIYSIFFLFLLSVSSRYAWRAWKVFQNGAEFEKVSYEDLLTDKNKTLPK